MIAFLQTLDKAALFVETITSPALIEQIATETGFTVGGTLYADALSGPDGPASTYEAMYAHNMNPSWGSWRTRILGGFAPMTPTKGQQAFGNHKK